MESNKNANMSKESERSSQEQDGPSTSQAVPHDAENSTKESGASKKIPDIDSEIIESVLLFVNAFLSYPPRTDFFDEQTNERYSVIIPNNADDIPLVQQLRRTGALDKDDGNMIGTATSTDGNIFLGIYEGARVYQSTLDNMPVYVYIYPRRTD